MRYYNHMMRFNDALTRLSNLDLPGAPPYSPKKRERECQYDAHMMAYEKWLMQRAKEIRAAPQMAAAQAKRDRKAVKRLKLKEKQANG